MPLELSTCVSCLEHFLLRLSHPLPFISINPTHPLGLTGCHTLCRKVASLFPILHPLVYLVYGIRRLYTWTSPDGQYRNQIDYILCSQRWRSSIQSTKTRPGADCDSGHELLITKFRLKLKKVGKTTRPFRYDLNQIPYDYTVEVRNRFKGLDLIDRMPDELWTDVRDIVQETGIKTIPMEKKCKKAKWLSEEALQIAVKRREAKSKGERNDISI